MRNTVATSLRHSAALIVQRSCFKTLAVVYADKRNLDASRTDRVTDRPLPQRMLLAISKRFSTSPARRSALSMLATSTGPAVGGPNGKPIYHTVTALKRWSCDDRDLPAVNAVKAIHVYDFDNTRMVYV